ncbi:MAG: IS1634 family transposase [Terriglobia bacterium]
MASLINKTKKGRQYTYWVESARVKGKPRIVEQVYLGPRDRVLEEIKKAYTRGKTPGRCPLRQVQVKEFGASAWLWHRASKLGLAEIVDRHVAPPPPRRRTPLSVGQYLSLAAVNRAVRARSKRSLHDDWYQHSVVSRLCPARPSDLSSQRFWDHMDQVGAEQIDAIQRELLGRLEKVFPPGAETLLYDTTNYYTFLDTFNQRADLARRGHNKQKRHDLRQLSLALFLDEKRGLPLYHRCYRGDVPDVSALEGSWQGLLQLWEKGLRRSPRQLTMVFDKGGSSRDNLKGLHRAGLHYVGAVPGRWTPDLLEVPLQEYRRLELPGSKHVKAHRRRYRLWERERTLVVVFSPSLYRRQRAAMNRVQAQVEERLWELAAAIERHRESGRGKGFTVASVARKIKAWTAAESLSEFLEAHWETEGSKVSRLLWSWEADKKRALQRRLLGKTVLFTDRHDWETAQIVTSYRKLHRNEEVFRISKGRRGPWWPMFHWTDSKVRVHALYCHFALLLLCILQSKLREAGFSISVDRCLDRLEKIQETRVIYANGSSERVLTEMDDLQRRLAAALGLLQIAEEVGNTVLNDA